MVRGSSQALTLYEMTKMKAVLTVAAVIALSSSVAFAEEKAPQQMSAAEMDRVVAGATQSRLRDGSSGGVPTQDRLKIQVPGPGTGSGTGTCVK
jgi:hypothetical protein